MPQWVQLSDEFYKAIGRCIAEWAKVDEALFAIFRQCVGPLDQCAIIYYRTPGLDVRLSLTDEIVKSVLPRTEPGRQDHPHLLAWATARKGFTDLLAIRRRIAHHPVVTKAIPSGLCDPFGSLLFGAGPVISGFELYASHGERLRGKASNDKPLTIHDLRNHMASVTLLHIQLHQFLRDALLAQNEEPARQAPSRPPERVPKKGTATAHQRRQKSSPP
jgi:hypothetical protein